MNFRIASVLLLTISLAKQLAAEKLPDLVQYVNTLQGTHSNFGLSHGNTFPATAMPYAQHMWTPQTGPNGEGFKYLYEANAIRGFGQSHQCSPWVSDYAVLNLYLIQTNVLQNSVTRTKKDIQTIMPSVSTMAS